MEIGIEIVKYNIFWSVFYRTPSLQGVLQKNLSQPNDLGKQGTLHLLLESEYIRL